MTKFVPVLTLLLLGCASSPKMQNIQLETDLPDAYQIQLGTPTQTDSLWWASFADTPIAN